MNIHDRKEAADQLLAKIEDKNLSMDKIFALPNEGVIIGRYLADKLDADMRLMAVESIKAPNNDMILGSVTYGGIMALKDNVKDTRMSPMFIEWERIRMMIEARRFFKLYSNREKEEDLEGETVAIVDDGSSDFSALVASVEHLRKKGAEKVVIAVPFTDSEVYQELEDVADDIFVLEKNRDIAPNEFYKSSGTLSETDFRRFIEG